MDNSNYNADANFTSFEENPVLIEKQVTELQPKNESLLKQLTNNKLYIYIIISIVVLLCVGYYLYTKYILKKDTNIEKNILENKKHILSSDTEYYLLDNSGNPILMNQHLNDFLYNKSTQQSSTQNQDYDQEDITEQNTKQFRHKSSAQSKSQSRQQSRHSNEDTLIEVNITDNEDDNIATQDLTLDEIKELEKQLDLMERKQTRSITAQNDQDGDEDNF
jgi:hypothetical protein